MTLRHADIIAALEAVAPPRLQEGYDNTGWQCGNPFDISTGALLCVDVTDDIVAEAVEKGLNLIITHHPLLFKATRSLTPDTRVNRALTSAVRAGVAVYSCHTAIDNAPGGISWVMAEKLGLRDIETLAIHPDAEFPVAGSGIVGNLPDALKPQQLVNLVKTAFGSPVVRCTDPAKAPADKISRVALCGGAGSDFICDAVNARAQAYITSDTKYNFFLDHERDIFLIDIGHWEAEECSKEIFLRTIIKKFPTFVVEYSKNDCNPINYL